MSSAGFAAVTLPSIGKQGMPPTGVTLLEYSDVSRPLVEVVPGVVASAAPAGVPEAEVQTRIVAACARERELAEARLRTAGEAREAALRAELDRTVRAFLEERSAYFARVEGEVVHLALAVARKILGREAQLDPMLLAGLVRVALDGMQGRPAVRVRVAPERVTAWQQMEFREGVVVEADGALGGEECVLVTEVGEARLSFEAQMKEVEQGFLDVLGQRPDRQAQRLDGQAQRPDRQAQRPDGQAQRLDGRERRLVVPAEASGGSCG